MDLGLSRRNIGRLVLLLWAVALAWLARREFATAGSAGTAERARRLEPGAQYFAVLIDGQQIGQLNLGADTLIDGVRLREQFVLDLPVGDSTRQLARGAEYYLSRALRLRNLTRTDFGIGPDERLDATFDADSILNLSDGEGSAAITGRVRLRTNPAAILPVMLPYRAAFGGHLRVGERFTVPLIELGAGGTRPLTVQVAAESTFIVADSASWDSVSARWVMATADTVRAWRLDHDATGAPTRSWVDAGGALVQEDIEGGISLRRSAFEIVFTNYRLVRRAESSRWRRVLPGMTSLVRSGRVPDTTGAKHEFLLARHSTLEPGSPIRWAGGRQSLAGDTLRVERETGAPGNPEEIRMAKGPSWDLPVLDSEVERIIEATLRRASSGRDSARALTQWVAGAVATDTSQQAFGTALNTLRNRRGSPDGKARLLATLARAAGIPARVVSGLAVLPQGVYAHSWTELWLGRWLAADPSYGHFPASASLIRVAVGERSRAVNLLPLVGSARILPIRSAQ